MVKGKWDGSPISINIFVVFNYETSTESQTFYYPKNCNYPVITDQILSLCFFVFFLILEMTTYNFFCLTLQEKFPFFFMYLGYDNFFFSLHKVLTLLSLCCTKLVEPLLCYQSSIFFNAPS